MGILYDIYMEDYLIEAMKEMKNYLGEPFDEATDKSDVYKINYYLRDNLQIPYISNVLAKRKNRDAIVMFLAKFMDDNHVQLSAPGPVYMFTFGDKETKFLYDLFGITAEEVINIYRKMVDETFFGKISNVYNGFVETAPHRLLVVSMLIESLQKDYKEIIECCEYLCAFIEYPMRYRYYWRIGVKEDVMLHTLEHLGNKFKVTKFKTLQGLLRYEGAKSIESNKTALLDGADHAHTDFIQRMYSQLNNTLKNISRAYYKNDKENATQHTSINKFDDGTLADQEGHTTNIAQFITSTINKFSTGEVNKSIVAICADGSEIDKNNLIGYINQIMSTKNNRLDKLIENIIIAFFNKNPTSTSLNGNEFVIFGFKLYRSIGTSKDPTYQQIKSIMNLWMDDIIQIRQSYSREATIISYTKAIFNYIILMINHYNS